jgi:maleate isomerase
MTARVGLIIPSSNRMAEQEMARAFPPGVMTHVTRLRMTGDNHLAFEELVPRIEEATRALTDARCDVVAFHCTANSMEGGKAGEEQILATLAGAGAARATTTITAIQRAFNALAARRIVLITPYSADTTEHEAEFLRQAGYDVLSSKGFALAGSDAYCSAPPQFWRDRAIEAAHPDAGAYLISCANISVFGVIRELEARLERPVVTSNQAVIWDTLRLIGWRETRGCPGQLFATTPADESASMANARRMG